MLRKNKQAISCTLAMLATGWHRLLLGLSLLLVAAACSSTPGNIGVGLPDVNANTGAYLVDTLTIKASTVLRDSIITSTSSSLLVGRYVDPQLGPITAKSYVTFSLGGSAFTPDLTAVADSLVLVLKPLTTSLSNPNTRYGDTTKTQTLVDVHRLDSFVPTTKAGYASPNLTPMNDRVRVASSNENLAAAVRRARPNIPGIRLRLKSDFRDELMTSGKNRQLNTQEQLDGLYPGLALFPAATDDAALVQFDATSTDESLILYYHDPADPSTVQSRSFDLSAGRHFYQVEAPRTGTLLAPLQTSLRQLSSVLTAQQTYIQGVVGLQTKLEIPYLSNLRSFGQHLIITSAVLTAEVPNNTGNSSINLPPPATLALYTTDQSNHQVTLVQNTAIGSGSSGISYSPTATTVAGVGQAGYTWSIASYCQAVVNSQTPNNGLLLNTASPNTPERVVLGGPIRSNNKLTLRLYLISTN